MPVDVANFLAQNSPRFNPTMMERERLTNALAQNRVDAAPLEQRALRQDIDLKDEAAAQQRQALSEQQTANARGVFGRWSSAIAQSDQPLRLYQRALSDPSFIAAAKGVGFGDEHLRIDPNDNDDSIRQQALDNVRVYGGELSQPEGFTLSEGQARYDSQGRLIASGRDKPVDGFTLGEGQARFDAQGNKIADGPPKTGDVNSFRDSMQLRKELEDSPPVKTYRAVLPIFERAKNAANDMAGDLSVIYALGKIFDPTSVVREGELQLSMNASPWLQKMAAAVNSQITGEGRLTPKMRAEILNALQGQVEALRLPYEQERARYAQYAKQYGFTENDIVGPNPAEAFGAQQMPTFNTEAEAEAAAAAGQITSGTRINIGGVTGVWQ
jgi:hypothetical protein